MDLLLLLLDVDLANARLPNLLVLEEVLAMALRPWTLRLTRAIASIGVKSIKDLVDLGDGGLGVQADAVLLLGLVRRSRSWSGRWSRGGRLRGEHRLDVLHHVLRAICVYLATAQRVSIHGLVHEDLAIGVVERDSEARILLDSRAIEYPIVEGLPLVLVSRVLKHEVGVLLCHPCLELCGEHALLGLDAISAQVSIGPARDDELALLLGLRKRVCVVDVPLPNCWSLGRTKLHELRSGGGARLYCCTFRGNRLFDDDGSGLPGPL